MAYVVKITYTGIEKVVEKLASPICSTFAPTGSYIDSPVYTEGNPVGAEAADKNYGKSIFATNVDGWGSIEVKEPFATTSIPFPVALAQFKVAVVSDKKDDAGHPYVEFEVSDYKEAFYYKEIGASIADQGFIVEVADSQAAPSMSVTGIKVVDGDDGVTEVTAPKVGQKLQAHILLSDGSDIGVDPVDAKAKYAWIKGDDTPLGSEGTYTVGVNAGDKISVTVTYEGATGEASWNGTVVAADSE